MPRDLYKFQYVTIKWEMKFEFLKRSFANVFGKGYSPTRYPQTITPNETNVYVSNCVFGYCSSNSSGGVISCGDSVYKFLIEQSTFISCTTSSSYKGGINFQSTTNGECALSKICALNCSSTYKWL